MTEDQGLFIIKAKESLQAARMLLSGGFVGFAASRTYYAMFYVAKAFLAGKGMSSLSKHSAVTAAFGKEFVKPKIVKGELQRYLLDAQDLRLAGDYSPKAAMTPDDVVEVMEHAEQFIAEAERLIGSVPPPGLDHEFPHDLPPDATE